ncbi:MAG: transposase [Candidatus Aramenus sulfurataquae]|jgi:hypothetical protein|uniref:Transposase n=2 Tax=Candidatus Aramenus sulfurataquae TaxID=1326980 RepID=W7L577_9CREN|nr:MAG: transposase [Candidatus Aramenus sulfurataquae]
MSYQNLEIEGIKKIRSGMLIYILGNLLAIFLAFIYVGLLFGLFGALEGSASNSSSSSASGILAGLSATTGLTVTSLISFAVPIVVGGILILLALLRVRDGFGKLVLANRDVGIGRTGATLTLVGAILEILGMLLAFLTVGLFIIPIADILLFIGVILLGIGLYKVGSIYQDTLTKVGGIVSIFLGFIGVILVYVGTGHILQKLSSYATAGATPSYAPTGPAVSTQNLIRGNGIATLTFYSQYQGTILSVQILGTQYITAATTPNTVGIGNNTITVNFNGPVSLSPGMTYTVRINLSNGAFVDVPAVYQP